MISSVAPVVTDRSRASERLLLAIVVSFLLHAALLAGIPVNPTGGALGVNSVITARLEPAVEEQPAVAANTETPVTPPEKSVLPDPLAEPAAKKAESKPETQTAVAPPASTPSAGVQIPLARDPTYYLVKELDVLPQPLALIQPQCPPAALNDRVTGGLELVLLINEFGIIDDVSVLNAQPAGYFEEASMAAFRPGRFAPAERMGHPVKARVNIRVRFEC